jgi:hypothetical protein
MRWNAFKRSKAIGYTLAVLIIGGFVNSFADAFLEIVAESLRSISPEWLWNGLEGNMGKLAALVLFIALFWTAADYGLRRSDKLLGSTAQMIPFERQNGAKYLIMGYSPMSGDARRAALAELEQWGVSHVALPTDAYIAACHARGINASAFPQNKWQQNIRAINHHKDVLKTVLVLAPNENAVEQSDFIRYVETAFPGRHRFIRFITERNSDNLFRKYHAFSKSELFYEDYDYVFSGVSRGLQMIDDENPSVSPDEICVDATSGNKTFSIAAAIATLNAECVFSYVNSDGLMRFYNASVEIGRSE